MKIVTNCQLNLTLRAATSSLAFLILYLACCTVVSTEIYFSVESCYFISSTLAELHSTLSEKHWEYILISEPLKMNYEKFLGGNLHNFGGQDFSQGGLGQAAFHGVNPFQVTTLNKFATPYQFPASSGLNPFLTYDGSTPVSNQGYGLKFANEPIYAPSAVETQQSHYGPPMMQGHKGGKLKGAALSALTLLAFLFFLNLLQSCLKDQMDAMHPPVNRYHFRIHTFSHYVLSFQVMVMSGQRNLYLNRDAGEDLKKANENFDAAGFDDEENIGNDYEADDYKVNGYSFPPQLLDNLEQTSTISSTKKRKVKNQQRKMKTSKQQQQMSLIESRLNTLAMMRQGLNVKSEID